MNDKVLSWFQIRQWWPVIASTIAITIYLSNISERLSIIEPKVNQVVEQQKELLMKYTNIEGRYGTMALQVKKIETIMNIR